MPALVQALRDAGLQDREAKELAEAIAADKPESNDGIGRKAAKWIGKQLASGVDLGVKGGVAAAVKLAEEAAMKYWGLK